MKTFTEEEKQKMKTMAWPQWPQPTPTPKKGKSGFGDLYPFEIKKVKLSSIPTYVGDTCKIINCRSDICDICASWYVWGTILKRIYDS